MVNAANDAQRAGADFLRDQLTRFQHVFNGLPNIDAHRFGDQFLAGQIGIVFPGFFDGFSDVSYQALNRGGYFVAVYNGIHGSTFGVAQDYAKRRTEVIDGIFDGGNLVIVGNGAGDADGEYIADALIEQDFRGNAGIGTTQDYGAWVLRRRSLLQAGKRTVGVLAAPGGKALVAGGQFL